MKNRLTGTVRDGYTLSEWRLGIEARRYWKRDKGTPGVAEGDLNAITVTSKAPRVFWRALLPNGTGRDGMSAKRKDAKKEADRALRELLERPVGGEQR